MESQLANHFRTARLNKGLNLAQLARLVGYKKRLQGGQSHQRF